MQYYALHIMYQKVHLLFIEIAEVAVERTTNVSLQSE